MREGWGSLAAGMGGGVGGTACALFFWACFLPWRGNDWIV